MAQRTNLLGATFLALAVTFAQIAGRLPRTLTAQTIGYQPVVEHEIMTNAEAILGTGERMVPITGRALIDAGAPANVTRGWENLLGPFLGTTHDAGAYELGLGVPWAGPRSFTNLLAYGLPTGWTVSPVSALANYTSLGAPASVPGNDFRLLLTRSAPSAFMLVRFEQMEGEARWSRLDAVVNGQAGDAELVKRVSFRDGLDARIVQRGGNAQFLGARVDDEGVLNVLGGTAAGTLGALQNDFFTFFRSLHYAWYLQDPSNPITLTFVTPPTAGFTPVGTDAPPQTSTAVSPGKFHGDVTLTNASIIWDVEGDEDLDATARVEFHRQGTSLWREALDLSRVKYRDEYTGITRNRLAGSIFGLSPGTTYDVRVTLADPDGGGETRTTTFTTRQVPKPFQVGRTIEVRPGDDLDTVTASAQPGDTFLLHAGTYTSSQYGPTWVITPSGTRERPILFRAFGDGEVRLTRINMHGRAHDIWLDGLSVDTGVPQAESWAIRTDDQGLEPPDGLFLTRNTVKTAFYQILLESKNVFITDNRLVGAGKVDGRVLSKAGIYDYRKTTHGNVAAYNHITDNFDGIASWGDNADVHNNKIHDVHDDAVEPDYAWANTRIYENLTWKTAWHSISVQQINGGPWYVFRNQLTGAGYSPFKLRKPEIMHVVANTIVMPSGTDKTWFFFRNRNIFANNFWKVRSPLGGIYDRLGIDDPPIPDPGAMRLWGSNRYHVNPCSVWGWWGTLQNAQQIGAEANTLLVNDPTGTLTSGCGSGGSTPPPSPPPPSPGPPPPSGPGGLVGYWKFEEGTGTVAGDASGHGNSATLLNGTAWGNSILSYSPKAVVFDGTDDRVDVPDADAFHRGAMTWSAWVNFASTGAPEAWLTKGTYGPDNGWSYAFSSNVDDSLRLMISQGGSDVGNVTVDTAASIIAANTWHHIVVVFNGGGATNADRLKLYLNGTERTLIFPGSPVPASLVDSTGPLRIGEFTGVGRPLSGSVDEVCIWDEALSTEEVSKLWNSGNGLACDQVNPPPPPPPPPPPGDATPPVISNVRATTTVSSATITWNTDEPSDSQVEYGTTASYGNSTTIDPTLVRDHTVVVTGLTQGTLYHYRVRAKDAAGNLAVSSDQTLTTDVPPPKDLCLRISLEKFAPQNNISKVSVKIANQGNGAVLFSGVAASNVEGKVMLNDDAFLNAKVGERYSVAVKPIGFFQRVLKNVDVAGNLGGNCLSVPTSLFGDLDNNGKMEETDLLEAIRHWRTRGNAILNELFGSQFRKRHLIWLIQSFVRRLGDE